MYYKLGEYYDLGLVDGDEPLCNELVSIESCAEGEPSPVNCAARDRGKCEGYLVFEVVGGVTCRLCGFNAKCEPTYRKVRMCPKAGLKRG